VRVTKRTIPAQQLALVEWAAELGAITAEALAVREECTVSSARARLLAAMRSGALSRERPLGDQPALFIATRAGLRAAGLDGVDPGRVSAPSARHSVACAWVAAVLEQRYADHAVIGERELLQGCKRGEPVACVAVGGSRDGGPAFHRPDLALCPTPPSLPIAVEVELTVKAPQRLQAICRGWARTRGVAGVLYFIAPQVRAPLSRAIAAARAERAIAVVDLDALVMATAVGPVERTITADA
jgi:hypothetical protein